MSPLRKASAAREPPPAKPPTRPPPPTWPPPPPPPPRGPAEAGKARPTRAALTKARNLFFFITKLHGLRAPLLLRDGEILPCYQRAAPWYLFGAMELTQRCAAPKR